MKLSLEQRPNYNIIADRFYSCLPKKYYSILVNDIQNDCDCLIESYEVSSAEPFCSIKNNQPYIEKPFDDKIHIEMHDSLNEEIYLSCFKFALNYAISYEEFIAKDLLPDKVIIDDSIDYINMDNYKYLSNIEIIRAPIRDINNIYVLSYPEYLGVLTCNINKFGMLILPNSIAKIKI